MKKTKGRDPLRYLRPGPWAPRSKGENDHGCRAASQVPKIARDIAGDRGHILFAVDRIADDAPADRTACIEPEEDLARSRVEGQEILPVLAGEDQPARSRATPATWARRNDRSNAPFRWRRRKP